MAIGVVQNLRHVLCKQLEVVIVSTQPAQVLCDVAPSSQDGLLRLLQNDCTTCEEFVPSCAVKVPAFLEQPITFEGKLQKV